MTILDDMPTRLAAAADHVESAKTAYGLAIAQRNAVIVEAVDDHGMSHDAVARHARVSQPHVGRVLRDDALADPAAAAAAL